MPRAVMLVFSGPAKPERENEYNKWYDETHLRDLCDVPGIESARRFKCSAVQSATRPPQRALPPYLALYELDTEDVAAALADLKARGDSGVASRPPEGLLALDERYEVAVYELHSSYPS